jgi:hypothetical protein
MADRDVPPDPQQTADEWFRDLGYEILLSEEDGVFWAALKGVASGVGVPHYGRGPTPKEAADRARQRYLEEQ